MRVPCAAFEVTLLSLMLRANSNVTAAILSFDVVGCRLVRLAGERRGASHFPNTRSMSEEKGRRI